MYIYIMECSGYLDRVWGIYTISYSQATRIHRFFELGISWRSIWNTDESVQFLERHVQ